MKSQKKINPIKPSIFILCLFIIGMGLAGCKNNQKSNNTTASKPSDEVEISKNTTIDQPNTDIQESTTEHKVNFDQYFKEFNGCAIVYSDNNYDIYNKKLVDKQASPCSTFKIISTIMGLDKGVIDSKNSKLGYDGQKYAIEAWNADVTLEEAFKESCLWYFEKIVSKLEKQYVEKTLDTLEYGNQDISVWNKDGHNGFWLGSSLKISPREQVITLKKIMEGETSFSAKDVELLKEIMLITSNEQYSIYGKTGTETNGVNGWFVGFMETKEKTYYFAFRLDETNNNQARGPKTKEIALEVLEKHYNSK